MTEDAITQDVHEEDEHEEDEIDGCDVVIKDENITLDEDLPAAEGGVA